MTIHAMPLSRDSLSNPAAVPSASGWARIQAIVRLRAQGSRLGTQNSELRTRNSELRTPGGVYEEAGRRVGGGSRARECRRGCLQDGVARHARSRRIAAVRELGRRNPGAWHRGTARGPWSGHRSSRNGHRGGGIAGRRRPQDTHPGPEVRRQRRVHRFRRNRRAHHGELRRPGGPLLHHRRRPGDGLAQRRLEPRHRGDRVLVLRAGRRARGRRHVARQQ